MQSILRLSAPNTKVVKDARKGRRKQRGIDKYRGKYKAAAEVVIHFGVQSHDGARQIKSRASFQEFVVT